MYIPPGIPGADQLDALTRSDAVDLLLRSIAMEEMNLSKLTDTERGKVLYALQQYRCGKEPLCRALEINRSVDEGIRTIAQLQMLLRFKRKAVQELVSCPKPDQPPCRQKKSCFGCGLRGTGRGNVENHEDCFDHCPISIYAFLPCVDPQNATIRYIVGDRCQRLYLYACDRNVKVRYGEVRPDQLTVYGKGRVRKYCGQELEQTEIASFQLTVKGQAEEVRSLRMELTAVETPTLIHDSGWVTVAGQCSDLRRSSCI